MTWRARLAAWLLGTTAPVTVPAPARAPMKINPVSAAEMAASGREAANPWQVAEPIGRIPERVAEMAMDGCGGDLVSIYAQALQGVMSEGLGFIGYPYLAELSQRPEYRRIAMIYGEETTRKWIKLSGPKKRVDAINDALDRFAIRSLFREIVEHDSFFGRGQIYVDMGDNPNSAELAKPLMMRKEKIGVGKVRGFKAIEPIWSYPGLYEATNPLSPNFYRPTYWQVQTARVHASRLLTFVGREMPDLLKPAYAFGGLSLSQMAKPYIDNWLRTRQSVSDLVHSFSTMVLETDLSGVLSGLNAGEMVRRADLFNATRDNRGLFMLDKDEEALTNVSTPLGTLDKLQAQSQEHIASVTGIPLVVLLGVTPSGLNASSDGEIKTFYATIKAYQERVFRGPLQTIIDILQLDLDGTLDRKIGFEFIDLWEMDEEAKARIRKSDGDGDVGYINAGVVSPDEVRERLSKDEASAYFGMDLSAPAPTPPETDEADADALDGALDAWEEGEHPRADNGQFGSGGGGAGKTPAKREKAKPGTATGREARGAPAAPSGPAATAKPVHPRIQAILGDKGVARLRELIAGKSSTAEQIADALAPVEAAITDVKPTMPHGSAPTRSFWASRTYDAGGKKLNSSAAQTHLVDVAKAYASDKGGVGVKYEGKARILLGPPAAGKSTSAEEIARQGGYAIADGDDAKKIIPEFDDGVGASAVHDESSYMGAKTVARLAKERANMILPLVGASPKSIRERIEGLKAAGYSVTVDLVDVSPDEAARRRAGRTLSKGRHISSGYAMSIGDGPQRTYETLKAEYPDLGFGRIDGNGASREERYTEAVNHPDASAGKPVFGR